nr:FliM/FliN family flagellar motor C-terminal domain-containing protein [uncultured Roseateles sp.]
MPLPQLPPSTPAALPLDPRTLGRPVHLLPRVADALRDAINEALRLQLNRRYRTQYSVSELSFRPLDGVPAAGRWQVGPGPAGQLGCRIDRPLVLAVMAQRYGGAMPVADANPPETASEERVQTQLSRLLLGQVLTTLMADAAEADLGELQGQMAPQFPAGSWLLRLSLREPTQGLFSKLVIALEPAYITAVLKQLAPGKAQTATSSALPLAKRLPLTLSARLLERPMLLGELLDLRPGDLIPIRIKDTEVLVQGSRLFTASVAEHQGKLCLTSFEDAE